MLDDISRLSGIELDGLLIRRERETAPENEDCRKNQIGSDRLLIVNNRRLLPREAFSRTLPGASSEGRFHRESADPFVAGLARLCRPITRQGALLAERHVAIRWTTRQSHTAAR
ncbi:hypothetical protein D3C80_656260 [compost metagenome]